MPRRERRERLIPYDHDDYQYVVDLGLIRKGLDGAEPSCPLYREVLARQLTYNVQENLPRPWWKWLTPEGRLDFPALVDASLVWWLIFDQRPNRSWEERLWQEDRLLLGKRLRIRGA